MWRSVKSKYSHNIISVPVESRSQPRLQTHKFALLKDRLSLKKSSVIMRIGETQETAPSEEKEKVPDSILQTNLIVRRQNFGNKCPDSFCSPSNSVLNFKAIRPIIPGFSSLDRAVREVPWESRFELLTKLTKPKFMSESIGTPFQEYQGGLVDSIRVRPTPNPYFKPNRRQLRQWNTWRSRDFDNWNPLRTAVRGSFKHYNIPRDLMPSKDELGNNHPPLVSARYQADVKRQFLLSGIPWIFDKDFMKEKTHIRDREPAVPKRWFKREFRQSKINESMKNMKQMVDDYREEKRAAKPNSWFEKMVVELTGEQLSSQYIRKPKFAKI